ncbi:MAG: MFS transporter, partial [Alphaproteobacteria bacterium]
MSAQSINGTTAERDARSLHGGHHKVAPGEIAVGVVIGRTSEFFDFFVYAIASVLVFPSLVFPYVDALTGTLYSFAIFALAFAARPVGTLIFTNVDRLYGRGAKLTIALFLLGGSTAAIAFLPGYETIGHGSALLLALFRMGQGVALGGSWDGLASLLAINAPEKKRGWYAMIPQLGAPIGLVVASLLFTFLIASLPAQDFLAWGWRYPFF